MHQLSVRTETPAAPAANLSPGSLLVTREADALDATPVPMAVARPDCSKTLSGNKDDH